MPLYGRSFTIRDSPTAVGSFHSGPGIGGQYTNEPGMIGYNEVIRNIFCSFVFSWCNFNC